MPLLKPEIARIINGESNDEEKSSKSDLAQKLEEHGLDIDSDLRNLSQLAQAATSESARNRAIETSLKLKGLLKEERNTGNAAPITIIINDPTNSTGVNPILFPRQMTPESRIQ